MTHAIATPAVSTISFAEATKLFGEQVITHPIAGQRNHAGQNKQGRAHITGLPGAVPTTQAIIQAVKSPSGLKLLDGYHRMLNWMTTSDGCPFESLILVSHPAPDSTDPVETVDNIDRLAQTIDNRRAVKTNADRWYGVMVQAGFTPKSNAYALGLDANRYLKESLGKASQPLSVLVEHFSKNLKAHVVMDELFQYAETHIPSPARRKYFNSAIAYAIGECMKTAGTKRSAFAHTVRQALLLASGYTWPNPPKAASDLASTLTWLASMRIKRALLAAEHNGERVAAVHALMEKPLASVLDSL